MPMNKLQRRRIDSAIDESKAVEARLETMGEQIELLLNDILDHQRTLHAIRLGMIREADEAAATPPEPAAGPFEFFSFATYGRMRDERRRVWAKYGHNYYCVRHDGVCWRIDGTDTLRGSNPDRIARINPPKETTPCKSQ